MKSAVNKTAKVQRGTSVTTAFLQLRELVVMGQLAPGSWVVEADLAERLGLSRTPVRGALQWLQREGYVIEHKSGTKSRILIAPLTMEDARELYSIVGQLEGMAGLLLGEHAAKDRERLAGVLKEINAQIHDIATETRANPRRVFDLDTLFHRKIVESSAGPRLLGLHHAVKPQIERYWRLYASTIMNELHISVSEHEEIIQAIVKGRAKSIEHAIHANWIGGLERIGKVIHLLGERGSW